MNKKLKLKVPSLKISARNRAVLGLLCLFLGVFLTIAFISYLFTWEQDQSHVFKYSKNYFTNKDAVAGNSFGKLGAYASHQFFYNWIGISSFFIPFLLFTTGFHLLTKKKIFKYRKSIFFSILFVIVCSLLTSYFFNETDFPWGGAFGKYTNGWIQAFLGRFGALMLYLVSIVSFILYYFNIDVYGLGINKPAEEQQEVEEQVETIVDVQENEELPNAGPLAPLEPIEEEINLGEKKGNVFLDDSVTEPEINPDMFDPNERIFESKNPADKKYSGDQIIEKKGNAREVRGNYIGDNLFEEKFQDNPKPIFTELPEEPVVQSQPQEDVVQYNLEQSNVEELAKASQEEEQVEPEDDFEIKVAKQDDLDLEVNAIKEEREHTGSLDTEYDPTLDLRDYQFPTLPMLASHGDTNIEIDRDELQRNKNQIVETLRNYKIEISKISATVGPTVTLYEIVPAPGVRISKIRNLEDDIALSLAALGIRIIAPIPGKGTIGIEVPNKHPNIVSMKSMIGSEKFVNSDAELPVAIGKTISNENYIKDLAKMPHLLIAGATGQGKSVGINALLVSLLYKKHPSELKFVLVDPKKVELSIYSRIEKHYLAKLPNEEEAIITDTAKVVNTLNSLCIEMDKRYDLLKNAQCRNIKEYNKKFKARKLNPDNGHRFLPYIVLVVDEFADLIMTAGKEVEGPIARLAQLARAIGIHLIIATQRPSVNIITGIIKANFPARIAFRVMSKIDSRTILDMGGADQLIGRGDLIYSHGSDAVRLQCPFVDTPEVDTITEFIGEQRSYPSALLLPEYCPDGDGGSLEEGEELDSLFADAARLVVQNDSGSTSMLQRRLKLGYNRAGRIMDQLERAGIVGAQKGSKPREVLFFDEMELEQFLDSILGK